MLKVVFLACISGVLSLQCSNVPPIDYCSSCFEVWPVGCLGTPHSEVCTLRLLANNASLNLIPCDPQIAMIGTGALICVNGSFLTPYPRCVNLFLTKNSDWRGEYTALFIIVPILVVICFICISFWFVCAFAWRRTEQRHVNDTFEKLNDMTSSSSSESETGSSDKKSDEKPKENAQEQPKKDADPAPDAAAAAAAAAAVAAATPWQPLLVPNAPPSLWPYAPGVDLGAQGNAQNGQWQMVYSDPLPSVGQQPDAPASVGSLLPPPPVPRPMFFPYDEAGGAMARLPPVQVPASGTTSPYSAYAAAAVWGGERVPALPFNS